MWITLSFLSALFAGMTAILSKIGVKNMPSRTATAIRTIIVFLFAWLMVFITGKQNEIFSVNSYSIVFLILSGLATGASWICYFKAISIGNVNQVMPVDKSSTILTMLFAFIFLKEEISAQKIFCIALIGAGTYLMIEKKESQKNLDYKPSWFLWAALSAIFAAITSILGKIGISDVDSTLGTAIRTSVVLIMAWIVAAISSQKQEYHITWKNVLFLVVSGITTGLSWLCYYSALKDGIASIVVPIDKLSILITVIFSRVILKEQLSKKALLGLVLLTAGTLLLLL